MQLMPECSFAEVGSILLHARDTPGSSGHAIAALVLTTVVNTALDLTQVSLILVHVLQMSQAKADRMGATKWKCPACERRHN